MTNEIPIYNESYTEAENLTIHEYISSASDAEIIEAIDTLCSLYSANNQKCVKRELDQLVSEIQQRDVMKQKYDLLLKCKTKWGRYNDDLCTYIEVLEIRSLYKKFQDQYSSPTGHSSDIYESFIAYHSKDFMISRHSVEFIRVCTFPENSSKGIKKPTEPEVYYSSLEEVVVAPLDAVESFKQLGTDNLIYLFTCLLRLLGLPNEECASVNMLFLTRAYSRHSHKTPCATFATNLMSYKELKEKNLELLEDIANLKQNASSLKKN